MPRYSLAFIFFLDSLVWTLTCLALTQNRAFLSRHIISVGSSSDMKRPASIADSISEQDRVDGRNDIQQAFSSSVAYLESLSKSASDIINDSLNDEDDDFTSNDITIKQLQSPRVVIDVESQKRSYRFDISLPTRNSAVTSSSCIGLVVRRISAEGTLSDLALDFDTLSFISHEDEKFRTPKAVGGQSLKGRIFDQDAGTVQLLSDSEWMKYETAGLVVSSVVRGGLAWEAGVRAGDLLLATSATVGDVSASLSMFYNQSELCL